MPSISNGTANFCEKVRAIIKYLQTFKRIFLKFTFFRTAQVILNNLLDKFFRNFNGLFYTRMRIVWTKIIYLNNNYHIF